METRQGVGVLYSLQNCEREKGDISWARCVECPRKTRQSEGCIGCVIHLNILSEEERRHVGGWVC